MRNGQARPSSPGAPPAPSAPPAPPRLRTMSMTRLGSGSSKSSGSSTTSSSRTSSPVADARHCARSAAASADARRNGSESNSDRTNACRPFGGSGRSASNALTVQWNSRPIRSSSIPLPPLTTSTGGVRCATCARHDDSFRPSGNRHCGHHRPSSHVTATSARPDRAHRSMDSWTRMRNRRSGAIARSSASPRRDSSTVTARSGTNVHVGRTCRTFRPFGVRNSTSGRPRGTDASTAAAAPGRAARAPSSSPASTRCPSTRSNHRCNPESRIHKPWST